MNVYKNIIKKHISKSIFAAILLCGTALLFLISYLILNVKGYELFSYFDVYADTAYAMEAWDHKSLFPENWVFGNQHYVVATPVVCALFYGLTGSINLAMILATTAMTLLLILTLLWTLWPYTSRLQRLGAVTLLLGGMITRHVASASNEGPLFFILASYYSCYLITIFVVIGDYLRALQKRKPIRLATLFGCLLLLGTGMQSLRQTAVLTLPLLAVEALRLFLLWLRKRRLEKKDLAATLTVGLYTAANFLGLIAIRLIDPPHTTIYKGTALRTEGWKEAMVVNWRIIRRMTGFLYAQEEPYGWLYLLIALLINGLVLWGVILSVRKAFKNRSIEDPIFLTQLILLIGILAMFLINLLIDMNFRGPYLFAWYAFSAVSASSVLLPFFKVRWKTLIAAVLSLACIANWFAGYRADVVTALNAASTPNVCREIADYLVENDYQYLYGAWGDVTDVCAYTDGKVLAGGYYNEFYEILPYINFQDIYSEEHNQKALYLLIGDHQAALDQAAARGATLVEVARFQNDHVLYSSDRQLMYHKN